MSGILSPLRVDAFAMARRRLINVATAGATAFAALIALPQIGSAREVGDFLAVRSAGHNHHQRAPA